MSTHVSVRGTAVRTISHSISEWGAIKRSRASEWVVGDFPATSKQMSDRCPGGSVSTAPGGNVGISGLELRCQSVHHPLSRCHSITASVRSPVISAENGKRKAHCRKINFDPLPFIIPSFSKTSASLRANVIPAPLPFSPAMAGFNHSTGTRIDPAAKNIRSHQRSVFSRRFRLTASVGPSAQTGDDGRTARSRAVRRTVSSFLSPPRTTHTYGFSPHPSFPSPLHLFPPPTPTLHTHTHTEHLFRDPLETQAGGGSPLEPLFREFLGAR